MDFRLGEKSDQLRQETREFLDEALTPEILETCHRTGVNHHPDFARALRDKGWLALGWPVEAGGQGRDPLEVLAHGEEMQRRNAPLYAIGTTMAVAHTIYHLGTEAQKAEILPKVFNAEILIALGFTEPENGSDAAAAATRAVRAGDSWTISGSKMFTTNAQIADYVFMLARTNPEAPKHRGLTTFLVPLDQAGVEVQAVHTMSGERTNITFYNDVVVSDDWRIGEVDGGWDVMAAAFTQEHTTSFSGEQWRLLDALQEWALETVDAAGQRHADDPAVRSRIGKTRTELEVSGLLLRRAVWRRTQGLPAHAHGSMSKLFSTERLEQQASTTLELVGRDGVRAWGDPTAVQGGLVEHTIRHAKGTTIYAGTSEIHRGIISQHVLGLPRSY
jgi:alkylation response protein AidB-like acyl-CoA dehydrogenase